MFSNIGLYLTYSNKIFKRRTVLLTRLRKNLKMNSWKKKTLKCN